MEHEIPSFNPATSELLGAVFVTSDEEVRQAYALAEKAFASWKNLPLKDRITFIIKVGKIIFEERDDLAKRITAETGKPLMESYASDVMGSLDAVTYYCRHAKKFSREKRSGFTNLSSGERKPGLTMNPWDRWR